MTAASRFRGRFLVLFAPLCLAALMSPPTVAADPPKATPKIDYGRDIRPILADNCYACHGPDAQQRKRKLRFDQRDSAVAELGDGLHAVVPGKSADSALIDRVTEEDPDRHMPPAKTGKTLTPQQIDLLRAWIDQGAPYAVHWAFVAPVKSEPPNVADDAPPSWVRNPIDRFILARLENEGLHPSPGGGQDHADSPRDARPDRPAADAGRGRRVPRRQHPRRLREGRRPPAGLAPLRRAHGPVLARRRPLRRHPRPAPRQLPRDLALPRLGHPAPSTRNKPFDRFIVEQLAGDLLPNATLDQIDRHRLQPLPRHRPARAARSRRRSTSATSSTRSIPTAPSSSA